MEFPLDLLDNVDYSSPGPEFFLRTILFSVTIISEIIDRMKEREIL